MELEALNEVLPQIHALGASLVVIAPELPFFNKDLQQRYKLEFDILYDSYNRVASQFGLTFTLPEDLKRVYRKFGIDLERFNGDDSWTLPMPSRFIIDENSLIVSAEVNPDYTKRPEAEDTVRALRQFKAEPQPPLHARPTLTVDPL